MTPRYPALAAFSVLFLAGSAEPLIDSHELDRASGAIEATGYIDARSYFTEPAAISAWYDLTFRLRDDFNAMCKDTFCAGDFSNYESLGFHCSVERRTGTIGGCVWILAASIDEVAPDTGEVLVENEAWRCAMPLAAGTRAAEFLEALSTASGRSLFAPLPGTDRVLYDGLSACL